MTLTWPRNDPAVLDEISVEEATRYWNPVPFLLAEREELSHQLHVDVTDDLPRPNREDVRQLEFASLYAWPAVTVSHRAFWGDWRWVD